MNEQAQAAYDALIEASRAARMHGFAVVIYTPEELEAAGVSNDDAEDEMIGQFNDNHLLFGDDQ